jgi:hypothetical protein
VIQPKHGTRQRQPCKPRSVKPSAYRIIVEGELGPRFASAFAEMRLEGRDGNTEIVGWIDDQAALQGVLDTITGLGLSLVSVTPLDVG